MPISWLLCAFLFAITGILFIKNLLLRRSVDEISEELNEVLSNESNRLISIGSKNKQIRRLTRELNRQLQLLRKQRHKYLDGDRELKEAVTNISHDIRTPLTAICGYLELLEAKEKSPAVERYLDIISNRVEVLEKLTEELFSYSVILNSGNEVITENLILNDLLEESIAGFYGVFKECDIEPIVQLPEIKVIRCLNPVLFSRILSNLLTNAVKYSDGDLTISLTESGELTFTNTVLGLDPMKIGKLFDRFYTITTAEKSTGLGLEITRSLVEQMDGHISADYEQNKLSITILFSDCSK